VGKLVGGYRLVTELRSGGMGTVYYAEHPIIGRRAAIKILHPEVSHNPQIIARFVTEARAANDIRHPNVVEITDIGSQDDLHYIIMSFLDGETLGERLERDHLLDEATTIRILRQLTSALGAAHERGIVHRDLKPENVFLLNHPDYPDYVKLLDFGIAKLLGEPGATPSNQTQMGTVLGTPAYMSPEQCRAQSTLDHRSDIYSLGVMVYEMLTGRVPFRGLTQMDVMLAHVQDHPLPPIEVNPKLARHLNDAILRALDKDPAKRFGSMQDLFRAIENRPALPATVGVDEETFEKREKREATFVVTKLVDIIMRRIQNDSLLIPAMPTIAAECMQILDDPNQSWKQVSQVVSKDPILASRVLRMANSAAFPSKHPATSLEQALPRMGTEGLKLALINFSMYQAFSSKDQRIQASFRGIWEHSLAVALISKEIADQLPDQQSVEGGSAYLAGLLHDVGKPVVGALLLEAEKLSGNRKSSEPWVSASVWSRVVNESHRRVGVALARKWKLPAEISNAIERSGEYVPVRPLSCSNVVCLANAVSKQQGLYMGGYNTDAIEALISEGIHLLGFSAQALDLLSAGLYQRVGTLFDAKPVTKKISS
jgi:putative nucleotidyltransferase with HDIG domain